MTVVIALTAICAFLSAWGIYEGLKFDGSDMAFVGGALAGVFTLIGCITLIVMIV